MGFENVVGNLCYMKLDSCLGVGNLLKDRSFILCLGSFLFDRCKCNVGEKQKIFSLEI